MSTSYSAWELQRRIQKVLNIELFLRLQDEAITALVRRINSLYLADVKNALLPEYANLYARKRAIETALEPYYDGHDGEKGLYGQAQEAVLQYVMEHHEAMLAVLEPAQLVADAKNPGIVSTSPLVHGFIEAQGDAEGGAP